MRLITRPLCPVSCIMQHQHHTQNITRTTIGFSKHLSDDDCNVLKSINRKKNKWSCHSSLKQANIIVMKKNRVWIVFVDKLYFKKSSFVPIDQILTFIWSFMLRNIYCENSSGSNSPVREFDKSFSTNYTYFFDAMGKKGSLLSRLI